MGTKKARVGMIGADPDIELAAFAFGDHHQPGAVVDEMSGQVTGGQIVLQSFDVDAAEGRRIGGAEPEDRVFRQLLTGLAKRRPGDELGPLDAIEKAPGEHFTGKLHQALTRRTGPSGASGGFIGEPYIGDGGPRNLRSFRQ